MIENTTQGFTVSGEENLLNKPSLFIGNHRDISMDATFLNYALYLNDTKTARMAIGDNLLDRGYAEDLMRLNKSFVVHRNIEGVKERFRKLHKIIVLYTQEHYTRFRKYLDCSERRQGK